MELVNEKLILAYGLTKEEQERLDSVLADQNILPCKTIGKDMVSMVIQDILSGVQSSEINIECNEGNTKLLNEKLLLFSNYIDKELYDLIASIKGAKPTNTILAAVTPTSIDWTVSYLLEHLIEEREAYRNNVQP